MNSSVFKYFIFNSIEGFEGFIKLQKLFQFLRIQLIEINEIENGIKNLVSDMGRYINMRSILFLIQQFSKQVNMQWTSEEDQCLLELFNEIQVYNRWKEISKKMLNLGFRKSEVECRNRYHNKLNPALSKEKWANAEVKKLFQSYDEYGSKWNLIEVFLPGRTQNNIKNRFFSTLKNLLRKVLKYFSQFSEKNMRYISSRDITDLYQGKARFKKFKGLFRRILKKIDFEVESKSLDLSIESYKDTLKQLSETVRQEKEKQVKKSDSQQKIIPSSEKTSDSNCLQEKNEEKSLKSFSFQADNSAPKTTTPSEFTNFFDLSLMNGFYFPQQTPWSNFGYQKPMTSPFIPFQIISPMSQYLNP